MGRWEYGVRVEAECGERGEWRSVMVQDRFIGCGWGALGESGCTEGALRREDSGVCESSVRR